jgi:hypothetical protein
LSDGQGTIIAKRSVSLSKTYPIIGVALALFGMLLSNVTGLAGGLSPTGPPVNATATYGLTVTSGLPFLSVTLQALAALVFATPVLLLYVYDKNNGILEYFLSLGMNQGDIYLEYLRAALLLAAGLVAFEVVIDFAAGFILGTSVFLLLELGGLLVVLTLSAVSFGTLTMMSFSSLQKQRVGSNQPLGMAIAVFTVMPGYLGALVAPSLAFVIDLLLSGIVVVLSLAMYFASSRLISREKLLP